MIMLLFEVALLARHSVGKSCLRLGPHNRHLLIDITTEELRRYFLQYLHKGDRFPVIVPVFRLVNSCLHYERLFMDTSRTIVPLLNNRYFLRV